MQGKEVSLLFRNSTNKPLTYVSQLRNTSKYMVLVLAVEVKGTYEAAGPHVAAVLIHHFPSSLARTPSLGLDSPMTHLLDSGRNQWYSRNGISKVVLVLQPCLSIIIICPWRARQVYDSTV